MPSVVGESQDQPLFPIFVRRAQRTDRYNTGYINSEGQVIIPPSFDDGVDFSEGLAAVRKDALWGFINTKGEMVIRPRFVAFSRFRDGLAPVCNRKGYGLIDSGGNELVRPQYDMIGIPADGMVPFMPNEFKKECRYGYLNYAGEVVTAPIFRCAKKFSEGLAAVQSGKLWGYITPSASFQIEPQFGGRKKRHPEDLGIDPGYFVQGLAPVWSGERCVFIDKTGRVIITGEFEKVSDFSEGRASFLQGGKVGFIDGQGTVVTEPKFSYAQSFSEGLAAVEVPDNKGLIGFVDFEGNWVINPRFSRAGRFRAGLCRVATENSIEYINKQGDVIWRGEYVNHGWY